MLHDPELADVARQIGDAVTMRRVLEEHGVRVREKRDRSAFALCPFRTEQTPSFHVYVDQSKTERFYCFGCGARGDLADLVQQLDGYADYVSTLRALADKYGIAWPSKPGQARRVDAHTAILDLATQYYEEHLTADARAYLETRGFSEAFAREWHIGLSPAGDGTGLRALLEQKRLVPPAQEIGLLDRTRRDVFRGRIVFPNRIGHHTVDLQGRWLDARGGPKRKDGPPKYLNLSRPHTHLFNEGAPAQRYALLCEGIPDTLSVARAGLPCRGLYGTQGWRSEYHRLFRGCDRVYTALDREAIEKSIELARHFGMRGRVLVPPKQPPDPGGDALGRGDLNEWLCGTCGGNPERFKGALQEALRAAPTPWALQIDRLPSVPADRLWDLDHLVRPILTDLAGFSSVFRDGHLVLLAQKYGLPLESFRALCQELQSSAALSDDVA